MIDLYVNDTNELVGSITDADLRVLVDALEEESDDDQDYWIDKATIDVLGDGRATEHLLTLLRKAVGSSDGVEIRWERRQ
jgi:hypothetical protein